jgi:hypothetical protein
VGAGRLDLLPVRPDELSKLRRLLDEAREISVAAGEEPREEPQGAGYFSASASGLDDAIGRVAGHEGDITMFVGAGVSTEAGLPSWNTLIRTLLLGVGDDLEPDDRLEWLSLTLSEGPLAAAAIANALYGDENEFRRAIRAALYGGRDPADYLPGALAGQLALLKKQLGPRLRLLTANYDGLLEAALEELGLTAMSYVRAWREPEGKHAVWHLHGRAMPNPSGSGWRSEGQLVLTEGDYARSSHVNWPREHVAERLKDSLCVFIGLSMTDPNFIRWLYRHGTHTDFDHLAIFVRQGAPIESEQVREKLERSTAARWKQIGVRPVWTNYYGEVAQLVHEIRRRIATDAAEPFADRAANHFEIARDVIAPAEEAAFVEAQADVTGWLESRVEDVRQIARGAGVDLSDHDIGLGLWGVDHSRGLAILWATSERALLDARGIEERPIHVASRWVGVEAVTRGIPVEQDPAVYTTRWRFIRGIPVVVDPTGERSVVGAMTLTSSVPLSECALSVAKAPPGLLKEVDRFLADSASEFFV